MSVHPQKNRASCDNILHALIVTTDRELQRACASQLCQVNEEIEIATATTVDDMCTKTRPVPELLLAHVENAEAEQRLLDQIHAGRLADAQIVVLCPVAQAAHWQQKVLTELISDYFVVRPIQDLHYLTVALWRAVKTALASRSRPVGVHSQNVRADLHIPNPAASSITPAATPPLARHRVLVIEDDPSSAELLQDLLRAEGFAVDRADSVMGAWRKYNGQDFDIVFLDLMLPGISGATAVDKVRDKLIGADTQLIITTAHSEERLVKECVRHGATDYIIKPITRDKLMPRVNHALAGLVDRRSKRAIGPQ